MRSWRCIQRSLNARERALVGGHASLIGWRFGRPARAADLNPSTFPGLNSSFLFVVPHRESKGSHMSSIDHLPKLEMLRDEQGSVILGWVRRNVLHAKFSRTLSQHIGLAFVARIEGGLRDGRAISYFSDASALEQYDVVARSAFARLVLARRRQFRSIVMLVRPGGITPATKALVSAIGEPVTLLTDLHEFDRLLTVAAPLARQRLEPRKWQQSTSGAGPRSR
jgi:hypothetical protein